MKHFGPIGAENLTSLHTADGFNRVGSREKLVFWAVGGRGRLAETGCDVEAGAKWVVHIASRLRVASTAVINSTGLTLYLVSNRRNRFSNGVLDLIASMLTVNSAAEQRCCSIQTKQKLDRIVSAVRSEKPHKITSQLRLSK